MHKIRLLTSYFFEDFDFVIDIAYAINYTPFVTFFSRMKTLNVFYL